MPERWLFVTYCPDPKRPYPDAPARYRCFCRAEDLREAGFQAAVISQQRFVRDPPLDFDRYVFHRPWYTQDFEGLLNYLSRRGKHLLADYDAPLFAEPMKGHPRPPFPEMIPHSLFPPQESFARGLRLFDFVTAATDALADRIREHHPAASVEVIESGLGTGWKDIADTLYSNVRNREEEICVGIGAEIQLDVALLGRILPVVLERRKDLTLIVNDEVRTSLNLPGNRIVSRVEDAGAHAMLAGASTLILPAASTAWNDCASGIRALEAIYLGCRVLASPLPGLVSHREAGLQFPDSEDQWIEALCTPEDTRRGSERLSIMSYILERGRSAIQTRRMQEGWAVPNP